MRSVPGFKGDRLQLSQMRELVRGSRASGGRRGLICPVLVWPLSRIAEAAALRNAQRSRPVLFLTFLLLASLLTSSSQIAQLQRCEPITEEEVKQLCLKAREILIEEGNVQVVDSPVTVCRAIMGSVRQD